MISIIIPIYNAEKNLRRCIESILSQTFSDFELILVDDGSSDNSLMICKEFQFQDNRIRVFHKANSGASSTRNFGIKKAKGEYLTFSDADDWVEPTWLEDMVAHIQDTDLVIQGYVRHCNGIAQNCDIEKAFVNQNDYDKVCYDLLNTAHMGYLWSMLFRLSIIRKYNLSLYEDMSFHEDLDFILRYLLKTDSFRIVDACAYHYYYEPKRYYHTVKGCYSILLSLEQILSGERLNCYMKIYRTSAYTSLLHNTSMQKIYYGKCFLKRFGRSSNGIVATVVSYILLLFPIKLSFFLVKILAKIKQI